MVFSLLPTKYTDCFTLCHTHSQAREAGIPQWREAVLLAFYKVYQRPLVYSYCHCHSPLHLVHDQQFRQLRHWKQRNASLVCLYFLVGGRLSQRSSPTSPITPHAVIVPAIIGYAFALVPVVTSVSLVVGAMHIDVPGCGPHGSYAYVLPSDPEGDLPQSRF